jgi:hypothetical protein
MDYDFITTCNWTKTGTYTLYAFRGSGTNVVTTHYASIFYRKKGTSTWTPLNSSGQMVVDSTGEWEVANDWNKNGNDCLTHSYRGITAINSCTDVYFNETSLGTTVGNYFLFYWFDSCSNLASFADNCPLPEVLTTVGNEFMQFAFSGCSKLTTMGLGFNLPINLTTVGENFVRNCWYNCTSLTSMPAGFNLPTGITSVGNSFCFGAWQNCTSLTSMPFGFNTPQGITSANYMLQNCWQGCTKLASIPIGFNTPSGLTSGSGNFSGTWYDCSSLKADGYTENIYFPYSSNQTFGGSCPITPDSPSSGTSVAVNRPPEPAVTTQSCTNIEATTLTGNGNIVGIGSGSPTIRGFCYKVGTSGDPTTSDSTVYDTGTFSTGAFTKSITGLTGNTSYRVRAYAINTDGTGYGETVTVTTYVAISGTVTLSGVGVEGAIVRIIQQDTDEEVDKQITDSDGNYNSSQLTAGKKYHVCVEYTDGSSNKYNSKSLWDIEAK